MKCSKWLKWALRILVGLIILAIVFFASFYGYLKCMMEDIL